MDHDEEALYSIDFDTRSGEQHARVLDYKYMRDSEVLMAPFPEELNSGKGAILSLRSQWMPLGTSLYVKWFDEDASMSHEDTVDLRGKLPSDMSKKALHFTVKGSQLSIYVVFEAEPPDLPKSERPFFATTVKAIKIYPQ